MVAAEASLEQVVGVALLNSAGQFGDVQNATTVSEESVLQKFIVKPVKELFQRVVLGFLFWQAKQPARIESVLKSVCQVPPVDFFFFFGSNSVLNCGGYNSLMSTIGLFTIPEAKPITFTFK